LGSRKGREGRKGKGKEAGAWQRRGNFRLVWHGYALWLVLRTQPPPIKNGKCSGTTAMRSDVVVTSDAPAAQRSALRRRGNTGMKFHYTPAILIPQVFVAWNGEIFLKKLLEKKAQEDDVYIVIVLLKIPDFPALCVIRNSP